MNMQKVIQCNTNIYINKIFYSVTTINDGYSERDSRRLTKCEKCRKLDVFFLLWGDQSALGRQQIKNNNTYTQTHKAKFVGALRAPQYRVCLILACVRYSFVALALHYIYTKI